MSRRGILLAVGATLLLGDALWWAGAAADRSHRLELARQTDAVVISPRLAELGDEMAGASPRYVDASPRAHAIEGEPQPVVPWALLFGVGAMSLIAGVAVGQSDAPPKQS